MSDENIFWRAHNYLKRQLPYTPLPIGFSFYIKNVDASIILANIIQLCAHKGSNTEITISFIEACGYFNELYVGGEHSRGVQALQFLKRKGFLDFQLEKNGCPDYTLWIAIKSKQVSAALDPIDPLSCWPPETSSVMQDTPDRSGYVYVVQGGKYHKIGQCVDINKRLSQFSPKLPFRSEIVYTFKVSNRYKAETFLHLIFKEKRSNGEWFELTSTDLAWIQQWDGRGF